MSLDCLKPLVSVLFFLIDLYTTYDVASLYFRHGKLVYFYFVIGFVAIPSLVMMILSWKWYRETETLMPPSTLWILRRIILLLQMAPVYHQLEIIYYTLKSNGGCRCPCQKRASESERNASLKSLMETRKISATLAIVKGFLGGAPLMMLKWAILIRERIKLQSSPNDAFAKAVGSSPIQAVTVTVSAVGMAFSIITFHEYLISPPVALQCKKGSIKVKVVQFLWHGAILLSKLFSNFTLLCTINGIICLISMWIVHWLVCFAWLSRRQLQGTGITDFATKKSKLVLAYVYIFTYFDGIWEEGPVGLGDVKKWISYLLFYLIYLFENIASHFLGKYLFELEYVYLKSELITYSVVAFFFGVFFMIAFALLQQGKCSSTVTKCATCLVCGVWCCGGFACLV